jgi:hypothetical protein
MARRHPVQSSSIAAIGYDDASETLDVEFVTGAVYRYRAVPRSIYEQFLTAPSKGQFFAYEIRPVYRYEAILKT